MNLKEAKATLPETDKNVIAILSGGLDSSSIAMLLVEHYGKDRVSAISFDYGQKQKVELTKAAELCEILGIGHKVLDLSILGEIAKPFSANIAGSDVNMPTIQEVLASPQPKTYVPNRNMIMYSLVAAAAEVAGAEYIFCGLQVHDQYGYFDTTQEWVDRMNHVLELNRMNPITIVSPFSALSKLDEIKIIEEIGKLELFKHTLTCYNPHENGESCGKCPSCAERIAAFGKAGFKDPIPYSIELDWDKIIERYKNV